MCAPETLGGGGLAHRALGPSRLLEQLTEPAREQILPGRMDGSQSMCIGLSKPNAGYCIRNVADGSNEILNRAIGQRLLKGDTDL
jgi:hypothetical protein